MIFSRPSGSAPAARILSLLVAFLAWTQLAQAVAVEPRTSSYGRPKDTSRERISINDGWTFAHFNATPDSLDYETLKPWMLASANKFTTGTKAAKPATTPAAVHAKFAQASYDDSTWTTVNVPHDWAIAGPFNAPGVSGGMGRLPSNGVGWYRRNLAFSAADKGKSVFLDVDGAMSYAAVWLNGKIVGGWPYGYASFRLDLTPYINWGGENVLALRVDNKLANSRWYPGAGIYRNVWIVKASQTHVDQYGTHITTPSVSADAATAQLVVAVENLGAKAQKVDVRTEVFVYDKATRGPTGAAKAKFAKASVVVKAGSTASVNGSATIANPQLWGPAPQQTPNLYVAVTTLSVGGRVVDTYQTKFGVRTLDFTPDGLLINGERIYVQGVNEHHDFGALGAAWNQRAAVRKLEYLADVGCNAVRTSHNPPATEWLELADEMGFLVFDEIFDVWEFAKVENDFHIIYPEWHEIDLRAFLRRDRNHASVIIWGYGNEIPEQRGDGSRAMSQKLHDIVRQEDPTRPTTASMDVAVPGSAFADVMDVISLNYQGEGRGSNAGTFDAFRKAYPNKLIWSSESASTVSTRGTYIFPVSPNISTTLSSSLGLDDANGYASAYELYEPGWGASADKVFYEQSTHPYVAGEFVWTGWDYIGEPTPYDTSRSSYFGFVDTAGFKKDRWYLYQARWRSDLPMAHILPHWSFANRTGLVTPVHVFTSADEAELFVNGKSMGRQTQSPHLYRFRWDDVVYQPGEVHVVTYKNGAVWATDTVKTVGKPARIVLKADRSTISRDGNDMSYISADIVDAEGNVVPEANNLITFSASGAGSIVVTDNGDPTDFVVFHEPVRHAFNGHALAVVRGHPSAYGNTVTLTAKAAGLAGASVTVQLQ